MTRLNPATYHAILKRMSFGTYPTGDKWWSLDLTGLSKDLVCIRVDFIDSPWNAAQRFWGYLCDFNLTDRFCATCRQSSK